MDKCRPIEAGCLAMVVPPACIDVGKVVQVIKLMPPKESIFIENYKDGLDHWFLSDGYVANEQCLLRVDDPDLQSQIENEQETVNG